MKITALGIWLLVLAGCASVPNPPGCDGVYSSLNPGHYTLQDTGHGTVETTTLGAG